MNINLKKKIKDFLSVPPIVIFDDWKERRLRKEAFVNISEYLQNTKSRKLQIGSGGTILEGWLNTDLILENPLITFMDAGKVFPLEDDSFDFVYSEHLFEHLTYSQQCNYLAESYRVLKPGGKIRIATPKIEFLLKLADSNLSELEKQYLDWNSKHFLNDSSCNYKDSASLCVYVINNYFKAWGHQLIHSENSIVELVKKYAFINIKFENVSQSDYSELRNLEHHMCQLGVDFNILETMIIEATKR
jgi:predicted SAM-dependent methyltransferase